MECIWQTPKTSVKRKKKQKQRQIFLAVSADGKIIDYLSDMGYFLHLLMPLKELWLGWQKKIVTAVDQARNLKNALTDLPMLKTICDNGKFSKSHMSRLSLYVQLMMATFKTSNLIILLGRKLQFIIMPSYKPKGLLDLLKAVSKKTRIKINKFSNSIYVIIIL